MNEKKLTDEVVDAKNAITDEEIVKALECCKQKGGKDTCKYCYTCPASVWDFEDGITECNVDLFQKAINLIHRLQSDLETCSNIEKQEKETNAELRQEIERLKEEKKTLVWINQSLKKQVDELKQENSILSVTVELQDNAIEQAVKDAAKEILDEVSKHFGGKWLVELYKKYGLEWSVEVE